MKHPRIVFPLALAAAILLGSVLGAHHSTRAEQTRREAVAQQHIDAAQFCQQLAEVIVQGEQDSLLAQYYGLDGMPEDTRAQLKERLSLLDMLPLVYQGCEEAGGEREISETEFWKDFALHFQVTDALPQSAREKLPVYLVSGIEASGSMVLTLTLCKTAGSSWTYQMVSANTAPYSI